MGARVYVCVCVVAFTLPFPCQAALHITLPVCFSPSSAAPHEICKDEHLLAMSWKRASAGETVYNKCPTNATGQSLCVL